MENPLSAQLSLTFTMQGATRQIATAFHYKITVSNESRLHVADLSWSCKMVPVALQLTQLTKTSKHLCSTFRWSLLLCRSKLTISSTKWQSPWRIVEWNRRIILSMPTDVIEHSVSSISSDSMLICLFISLLVPLRPLVGLRPPSNSFILSFRLTMLAAVQNTTPEGVPSKCWCSLTLTLATSMCTLDGAGATKSWFHSATLTKSFALAKKVSTQLKFCIWTILETLSDESQIRIGDTHKTKTWCVKGYGARNVDLLLYNCPVLV